MCPENLAKLWFELRTVQPLASFSAGRTLTLTLLTWRIRRVPNNASRWQMGFNLSFKELD